MDFLGAALKGGLISFGVIVTFMYLLKLIFT